MATSHSPLRYPGGKQILARVLAHLITLNGREGGIYAEPYAGGAGAALALLYGGYVRSLMLNDADPRVYAFWMSVTRQTEGFLKLLHDTPLTVEEWQRQKTIYRNTADHNRLAVGFATFYLNRCNRSGIIGNGGLIGGLRQTGKWKLDARFNRHDLKRRVERIGRHADRIKVSKLDAIRFLQKLGEDPTKAGRAFVYLDPPYFFKGSQLYLNHYKAEDHAALAQRLAAGVDFKWVMTYDNVAEIRKLYPSPFSRVTFSIGYSASEARVGTELLIHDGTLAVPKAWRRRIGSEFITAADGLRVPMPV
jgi:DNA adenine methylase